MRVFCFLHIFVFSLVVGDLFEEELLVKDLDNGFSGLHFNFVTHKPYGNDFHFHIFPKQLYSILTKYNVDEFHLSMVQGFWDRPKWGPPFVSSASGGAEIWVWFSPQTTNVDKSWAYFLEALSGQFCASLSQLGLQRNFIIPQLSHRPSGLSEKLSIHNVSKLFRYAQLPHEELCTENLTPWSKLLPCKRLSGLASMLKPRSIYKATYNSLSVDFRRVCSSVACKELSFELKQSITLVFDRRYMYRSIQEPWSLIGLLGNNMSKTCPVATRSEIIVLQSHPRLRLQPPAEFSSSVSWDVRRVLAAYRPSITFANDLIITSSHLIEKVRSSTMEDNGVSIMKYATGKGDVDGGVKIELYNRLTIPVRIVLLDAAPWYTEVYFSSLVTTLQNREDDALTNIHPDKVIFHPSVPRKKMSSWELLLKIPPDAQITVSYAFKKILMRWNEFPPDANHGIYLPAASAVYQFSPKQLRRHRASTNPATWELALPLWSSTYAEYLSMTNMSMGTVEAKRAGEGLVRLYSETLLVRLPVPDFSMPFNALCLVCSVVAFLFGLLHKISTSNMAPVIAEGDEDAIDRPPLVRLFRRLKDLIRRLRGRAHMKTD